MDSDYRICCKIRSKNTVSERLSLLTATVSLRSENSQIKNRVPSRRVREGILFDCVQTVFLSFKYRIHNPHRANISPAMLIESLTFWAYTSAGRCENSIYTASRPDIQPQDKDDTVGNS